MTGRSSRKHRFQPPALEGLESRLLLTTKAYYLGKPVADKDLTHLVTQLNNNVPLKDRRIAYTTPEGTKVQLTLFGRGSLAGTTVNTDGSLNLLYRGTNTSSKIVGYTSGGTGFAPLASLRDVSVAPRSSSASGSEPLNIVNLKHFDLIAGGYINIEGGVGTLALNSAGPDSQIHVTGNTTTGTSSTTTNTTTASAFPTASGITTQSNTSIPSGTVSTGGSTATGSGTGGSSGGTSSTGSTSTTVTGTTTTTTNNSGIATTSNPGAATSTTTSGATNTFTPSSAAVANTSSASSTTNTATGVEITIKHVDGAPRTVPIGDPQIFGYDPTANTVIRFDAVTGLALQTIHVPFSGTAIAGTGLGRNNGRLVVLVGSGTTIAAFDAVTGDPAGSFSTASLAAQGLTTIDGIGSSDTNTYVSSSTSGAFGLIEQINVTASLATGQAVPVGTTFAPTREFELTGGLTGVAGTNTIYTTGAGRFDLYQPDETQLGILGFTTSRSTGVSTETIRNPILNSSGIPIDAGPPGTARSTPTNALGSIGQFLALDTGVSGGLNNITLLSPASLAPISTVTLADANRLTGLSESFHPELENAVLVDVSGNVKRFQSDTATGLALTSTGIINLLDVNSLTDSAVVGRPLNHVSVGKRQNVQLLSSARGVNNVGTRGGVTVKLVLPALGELTLP